MDEMKTNYKTMKYDFKTDSQASKTGSVLVETVELLNLHVKDVMLVMSKCPIVRASN